MFDDDQQKWVLMNHIQSRDKVLNAFRDIVKRDQTTSTSKRMPACTTITAAAAAAAAGATELDSKTAQPMTTTDSIDILQHGDVLSRKSKYSYNHCK
jgi:recombination DNA repair RAD52 pathway protein